MVKVSTLKKMRKYRHKNKKAGVDVIPLEDREVSIETFSQYIDVTNERKVSDDKSNHRD